MKRIIFILCLSVILTSCSSNKTPVSNEIKNKSKQVGEILINYMQDGKQIDSSQQRIIDAYVSKYGEKLSSFNEYEQGVINNILKMNNDMYYYNTYNKYSDKLKAMERFNQDLAEFKEIDQSIK